MEALPDFDLLSPTTLAEVLAARKAHPGARLLGGGRPERQEREQDERGRGEEGTNAMAARAHGPAAHPEEYSSRMIYFFDSAFGISRKEP